MTLTVGSLFSGVGGFDLGFERAGMAVRWQCEKDTAARSVLRRHWPDVTVYEDVREIGAHNLEPVNVICGGFPCQDLSVAGKRAGLAGNRSGLWFEFARIVREMLPEWVVVENVPGLLSSNGGKDIQIVVDTLTQIGYTVDIDIKDSQEFGVPQRRRRVYLTCARLDGLLRKKTPTSRQISANLAAQQLADIWGVIQPASSVGPILSASARPTERCLASLRKRTGLFGATLERLASSESLNIWDVLLDQCGDEASNLMSGSTVSSAPLDQWSQAADTCESLWKKTGSAGGHLSMSTWLNNLSDAVCVQANKSITSTSTPEITDQTIFSFAVAALYTTARTLRCLDWSVNCWSVAQSALTLIQENMKYARQATDYLFVEPRLRDGWRDYLRAASSVAGAIERGSRIGRAAEVLFERESGGGHPAPGGEAGQGITASPRGIAGTVSSKWAKGSGVPAGDEAYNLVAADFRHQTLGDCSPTLQAKSTGGYSLNYTPGVIGTLAASGAGSSRPAGQANEADMLVGGDDVRRLTPLECERLQGFTDGWTAGQSDAARYRQMGNAVTVNVAEWIGRRIVEAQS